MPVLLLCVGAVFVAGWRLYAAPARLPVSVRNAAPYVPTSSEHDYVSSRTCRSCHPGEYESWHGSYHRTMTQLANPASVVGAFDGTTIISDGLAYRVFEEDGTLMAELPVPEEVMYVVQGGKPTRLQDIPRVERTVVLSTGSHHYQTYWVTGDPKYGNLLQTLPLVYLLNDQRWIPREAAFMRPRNSSRMVTQWNHHCIRCHSTGGNPGLIGEGESARFATRVGELGIACEACHGPAQRHVARYKNPAVRYAAHLSTSPAEQIANPQRLDHRRSSQVCGQCHGVFLMHDDVGMEYARQGSPYRPGQDLHETYYCIQHPASDTFTDRQADLALNQDFFQERWWDDGTILAGGREFTAMRATACYQQGQLSCLSCHTMHHGDRNNQLKPGMDTNLACTGCHDESRFTKQLTTHTHHAPGSDGSNCLNCHMPHTTYALFDAIRSHQIASPRAAATIEHGTPNACNLCHLDKTIAWTQQRLAKWYGHEIIETGADEKRLAAAVVWMLKGNAAQRVIAAWHAGWQSARDASGEDWLAPHLAVMLADSYGVVRYVGARSLRRLPGFEDLDYDFLASDRELADAAAVTANRWSEQATSNRRRGSELLVGPDGQLLADEVRRLLRERDNRPVFIKE